MHEGRRNEYLRHTVPLARFMRPRRPCFHQLCAQPGSSTSTSWPVRVPWATRSGEKLQQAGDDACGQSSAVFPAPYIGWEEPQPRPVRDTR